MIFDKPKSPSPERSPAVPGDGTRQRKNIVSAATLEFSTPVVDRYDAITSATGPVTSTGDVHVDGLVGVDAEVRAARHIVVKRDITGATVFCAGTLQAPNGSIVGGIVSAGRGLTCRTLGDAAHTPTEVQLGFNEAALESAAKRTAEIEQTIRKAEDFHKRLQPLLHQKDLTPEQKEQVSEHLYRAQEAKKRAAAAIEQLKLRLCVDHHDDSECVVTTMIHAGVALSFPGARTVFASDMNGPVQLIALRGSGSVIIRATDMTSGKTRTIESVPHEGRCEAILATLATLAQGLNR